MKYIVRVIETVVYDVPVTAKNENKASVVAINKIINTRNRDKWCVEVTEREVDFVGIGHAPAMVPAKTKKATLLPK